MKYQFITWAEVIKWLKEHDPIPKAFLIWYSDEADSYIIENTKAKGADSRFTCFGTATTQDTCLQCPDNEACIAETMKTKTKRKFNRYHVVVAMNPWVFDDDFPKKPDKNSILEVLMDKLKDGELDDNFVGSCRSQKGGCLKK